MMEGYFKVLIVVILGIASCSGKNTRQFEKSDQEFVRQEINSWDGVPEVNTIAHGNVTKENEYQTKYVVEYAAKDGSTCDVEFTVEKDFGGVDNQTTITHTLDCFMEIAPKNKSHENLKLDEEGRHWSGGLVESGETADSDYSDGDTSESSTLPSSSSKEEHKEEKSETRDDDTKGKGEVEKEEEDKEEEVEKKEEGAEEKDEEGKKEREEEKEEEVKKKEKLKEDENPEKPNPISTNSTRRRVHRRTIPHVGNHKIKRIHRRTLHHKRSPGHGNRPARKRRLPHVQKRHKTPKQSKKT